MLEFDASEHSFREGGSGNGFEWPDNEHGFTWTTKTPSGSAATPGTGATLIQQPWRDDDMLLKFTTRGRFIRQFGKRDQSGGNKDTKNLKEPADLVLYARRMRSSSPTDTATVG